MRPEAKASGYLEARARARASATTTANTEVLHCVQDDEIRGNAEEDGRAELDTPPFAKCTKGRAPRVVVG